MNVALLNRKRSRLALDSDDEFQREEAARSPSPLTELKRSKTQCELEEIAMVAPEDAWPVDVEGILSSPTIASCSNLQPHNNASRYVAGASILVLCVQGNLHLHYDLLCALLPDLYSLSPSLQALVLCRDPSTHIPSKTAPFCLPLIQAVGANYNHFVKLGLLHPIGGGHFPLDALVVVDPRARRRIVLPFGWGAGRYAGTPAGKGIQSTLMEMLRNCVTTLIQEP